MYNLQQCNFLTIREKKIGESSVLFTLIKFLFDVRKSSCFHRIFAVISERWKTLQWKQLSAWLPSPSAHPREGFSDLKMSSKALEQYNQDVSNSKEAVSSKLESSLAWTAASQWSMAFHPQQHANSHCLWSGSPCSCSVADLGAPWGCITILICISAWSDLS